MANTEIMATLAKVRTAKLQVDQANTDPALTPAQSDLLTQASLALNDLENKLILEDIQSWINQIAADGRQLTTLSGQIKNTIASLNAVAQYIQAAATAVGALASALAAANSGGLLH